MITFFTALLLCFIQHTTASIWPPPRHETYRHDLPPLYITSSTRFVSTTSSSPILTAAFQRYNLILQRYLETTNRTPPTLHAVLHNVTVIIVSPQQALDNLEKLSGNTSFRYNLTLQSAATATATITADTVFGAMHGLETFVQLFRHGSSPVSHIRDEPKYQWRGLMLDVGRRFSTVSMIQTLLDTMASLKMSVLHFHASDYCRWSIESKLYPQLHMSKLQPGMKDAGYFTQDDVRHIVSYAKERGIRVVPEFDLPGHVYQWAQTLVETNTGLTVCSGTDVTIYNDPAEKSFHVLHALLGEMTSLFEDDVFHIGMDEVVEPLPCTSNGTLKLKQKLLLAMQNDFGKQVMGWNPIASVALSLPNISHSNIIINSYMGSVSTFVKNGFTVVDSSSDHWYQYLTHPAGWDQKVECRPAGCSGPAGWDMCWYPPGGPLGGDQILGGEVSAWTDDYVKRECGAHGPKLGLANASCFYSRTMDKGFAASLGGLIWPRGIVAAGAFYNYNNTVNASSPEFVEKIHQMTEHLQTRGLYVCPTSKVCSYVMEGNVLYPGINRSKLNGFSCASQD